MCLVNSFRLLNEGDQFPTELHGINRKDKRILKFQPYEESGQLKEDGISDHCTRIVPRVYRQPGKHEPAIRLDDLKKVLKPALCEIRRIIEDPRTWV
jgi:hypothetical protein